MKYVLLDFDGNAIRYFDYEASGTVPVPEPLPFKIDWSNFQEALL